MRINIRIPKLWLAMLRVTGSLPARAAWVWLAILLAPATCLQAGITFESQPGKVAVLVDGQLFANFYYGPEWHAPFLHPLRAASGVSVTRGFPLEQIAGETQDHTFHRGLWFTHAQINGVDFWRDKGPDQTGRIVAVSEPKTDSGRLTALFVLRAPSGSTLGSIAEDYRFGANGPLRYVDVAVTIFADRGEALELGDVEEAGLGLRMRDEFREDRGAVITNANGETGSKTVWGKRAPWIDYSSTVNGEKLGVTIFDHPANPRYPTYWHARGYAFCAANAFGERSFLKDPSRNGAMTIPAGESLTFRYRVVIHPGDLSQFDAAKMAADFAKEK